MIAIRSIHTIVFIGFSIAALLITSGCGYTMHGRVIRGQTPGVEIVHQMDLRLRSPAGGGPTATPEKIGLMPAGAGLNNVEVSIYRDPTTLNRRLADRDRTNGDGWFTFRLDNFGAGWMEEQWQVSTMASGYGNVVSTVKLPPDAKKWRLLITVAPGTATPPEPDLE